MGIFMSHHLRRDGRLILFDVEVFFVFISPKGFLILLLAIVVVEDWRFKSRPKTHG